MSSFPPVGPRRITSQRQLAIPAEVMDAAKLEPGVEVYCQALDDPPGTVLLIPAALVMEWIRLGRERD